MIVRPILFLAILALISLQSASAQSWPTVNEVDRQPLVASIKRLATALDAVGRPLSAEQQATLDKLFQSTDDGAVVAGVQTLLDRSEPDAKSIVTPGVETAFGAIGRNGAEATPQGSNNEAGVADDLCARHLDSFDETQLGGSVGRGPRRANPGLDLHLLTIEPVREFFQLGQ